MRFGFQKSTEPFDLESITPTQLPDIMRGWAEQAEEMSISPLNRSSDNTLIGRFWLAVGMVLKEAAGDLENRLT